LGIISIKKIPNIINNIDLEPIFYTYNIGLPKIILMPSLVEVPTGFVLRSRGVDTLSDDQGRTRVRGNARQALICVQVRAPPSRGCK
jgi:hypothetical protein